jgi:hypothetical protein
MKFFNKRTGGILEVSSLIIADFLSKTDKFIAIKNDDGEHWITLNGGDNKGTHVLITGEGKIIGGAGDKLNGKMLKNVKSQSGNVEKHGAPIPQNPPKPSAEPPKETAEPPKVEPPKEQPKSEPTPQESVQNIHNSHIQNYESLENKAKGAKTPDEILAVMNEAKDLYTHFRENWRTGNEQEQMANRERYLKSAETYNKLIKKYNAAKKKIANAPAFSSEKDKELSAKFSKTSIADISTHFKDKYGIGFENGSNTEREAKKLWAEYLSSRKEGNAEKSEAIYKKYHEVKALARSEAGGKVRSHTSYDIDDGSAGAKAVRKNLGYLDSALSSLDAGGFDLKGAMARANVKFAAGSTGKALGHSWQDRTTGVGYFALSISQPINGSEQQMKMAQRRKERGDPLFTVSSGTDDVGRATIVHELAHAIGMQKDLDSPGKLQKTLTGLFPDIRERRNWIRDNLSEYALSNYHETDAELAALVTAPYYKRGTLPKQLEDHVDWLFMKRKE